MSYTETIEDTLFAFAYRLFYEALHWALYHVWFQNNLRLFHVYLQSNGLCCGGKTSDEFLHVFMGVGNEQCTDIMCKVYNVQRFNKTSMPLIEISHATTEIEFTTKKTWIVHHSIHMLSRAILISLQTLPLQIFCVLSRFVVYKWLKS